MSFSRRHMPSFQELVAFEAVARRGNFTRAAEELALTQSAVSKQLQQLERSLGAVLLKRNRGQVSLTPAGFTYLNATQEILARFRMAAMSVGATDGNQSILNVVVLPTFAAQWLMPRLPRFLESWPNLTVNLTTRVEPYDFHGNSYDVAIHYAAVNWQGPDAERICEELFVPVVSPEFRDRFRLFDASDVANATLLQQADRPGLWSEWFEASGIICRDPYRGPVLDRFSMTIGAARAGLGVALVPMFLVATELASKVLVTLSTKPYAGAGAYYALIPPSKLRDRHATTFREWLVKEGRSSQNVDTEPLAE
jgi:LysR family glycine cleavage system transcriptional activator